MVLMTIILKEYLESRHRDRCVPSPTRENRQLAPKGLGGLAVNMVIMTVRIIPMKETAQVKCSLALHNLAAHRG